MIHYLLLRDDGSIAQRGYCPTEDEVPVVPGLTPQLVEEEDTRQPAMKEDTYIDYRRMAYPPIGEQLDAIWKFLSDKPLSPEAAEMLARVQAVKQQYPKEE